MNHCMHGSTAPLNNKQETITTATLNRFFTLTSLIFQSVHSVYIGVGCAK